MQVNVATKVQLVEGLVAAGLRQVEVTSFVSPKWVPQLADAAEVYRKIAKQVDVKYPVLVPNMKVSLCKRRQVAAAMLIQTTVIQGFQAAMDAGATEIAVFTAASEQVCWEVDSCLSFGFLYWR